MGLIDLEILERALCLCAPVFVGGDLDFAKGVGFGAGGLGVLLVYGIGGRIGAELQTVHTIAAV